MEDFRWKRRKEKKSKSEVIKDIYQVNFQEGCTIECLRQLRIVSNLEGTR